MLCKIRLVPAQLSVINTHLEYNTMNVNLLLNCDVQPIRPTKYAFCIQMHPHIFIRICSTPFEIVIVHTTTDCKVFHHSLELFGSSMPETWSSAIVHVARWC